MEEIEDVVKDICQGCAGRGQRVPAVLAAFIARTILENDPLMFSPEKRAASTWVAEVARELDTTIPGSDALHRVQYKSPTFVACILLSCPNSNDFGSEILLKSPETPAKLASA